MQLPGASAIIGSAGQRLRWQFVRHLAIGVLLALAGMGVASYLEATL